MSTVIHCPSCDRQLRVPDNLMGQKVKCPSCTAVFVTEPASREEPPLAFAEEVNPSRPSRPENLNEPEYDDQEAPRRRRGQPTEEVYEEESSEESEYDQPRRTGRRRRRMEMRPHRASLILTLGILSFFCFGFILGPMAWIMGSHDLKEMRAGRMDPEGEGVTNAGRICGMIATLLIVGSIFVGCLWGILAGLAGARR